MRYINLLTRLYIIKRMHSKRKCQKNGFQHMPLYKQP